MRHNKKRGMKLGTDASHTKAMKKSLICALLANDRIKTLDQRAKAIRPCARSLTAPPRVSGTTATAVTPAS